MSVLVLTDRDMENGRYFEGFLADSFAPNCDFRDMDNLAYKCYIPYTGKVARVPEMSRYFFYNNLKQYDIDRIYLTSENCTQFVTELRKNAEFDINGYVFEKAYREDNVDIDTELVLA